SSAGIMKVSVTMPASARDCGAQTSSARPRTSARPERTSMQDPPETEVPTITCLAGRSTWTRDMTPACEKLAAARGDTREYCGRKYRAQERHRDGRMRTESVRALRQGSGPRRSRPAWRGTGRLHGRLPQAG